MFMSQAHVCAIERERADQNLKGCKYKAGDKTFMLVIIFAAIFLKTPNKQQSHIATFFNAHEYLILRSTMLGESLIKQINI